MNTCWLIAIDDTDNADSIGTGRLARELAGHLVAASRIALPTVTRHQLLVHPDIPYTSHNSSACIAATADAGAGPALFELARAFLLANEHAGANPGLCVAPAHDVPPELPELGRRAQRAVLDLDAFDAQIESRDLLVWSSGQTGQGRIGAVCGVALRSTGEDGRFIDLPGIRSIRGRVRVAELVKRTGVDLVVSTDGDILGPDVEFESRDWIRPALRGGRAVLALRREGEDWSPVERRTRDDG